VFGRRVWSMNNMSDLDIPKLKLALTANADDASRGAYALICNLQTRITELEAELGEAQRLALHKAAQYRVSNSERDALKAVLQQVVDETAHLDCYSQATTNKILAALPPQEDK